MQERIKGKIIKGVGGLYEVDTSCGAAGERSSGHRIVTCRARGIFRYDQITPLVGDDVEIVFEGSADADKLSGGAVIDKILPRKNQLIRPPMANLDYLFLIIAAKNPDPQPLINDKLISIAEYNKIEPVVIVNKKDLDAVAADNIVRVYKKVGIPSFAICKGDSEGIGWLHAFIKTQIKGRCAAFAGVSGAGKSTLLNELFPQLRLETSEVSRKLGRGRHTTRRVELYPINEVADGTCGYLADTPGFSMLDFEQFDFFTCEDLPYTFREFEKHIGCCKYTKCTHTKEDGCAILEEVRSGKIPKSRHDSFVSLYEILKNKKAWKK
ncbi:MAG: ribosome small subunit-dependent GTPase A [Clostridiales bacterium]|nr:ribosome small subunit-dependent GTPase A [Clostridiales bacterium]